MLASLAVEADDKPAITSLRLLAVLGVLTSTPLRLRDGAPNGEQLVLTDLSRTSPRHL